MSTITFDSLELKSNTSVKELEYNGSKIEVKQYLPIEDKNDLIQITLQKAKENGTYNVVKLEMYFNLHIVYLYTNLSFTDEQKENESELYDLLENNGIINAVVNAIGEKEYETLYNFLMDMKESDMQYNTTMASIIKSLITDLPANAQAAVDMVNSITPENFQNIQDMIKLAESAGIGNERIVPFNTSAEK